MNTLNEIEEAWDLVEATYSDEQMERFYLALYLVYQLHGEPFGSSAKGLILWARYSEGTTSN